MRGKHDQRTVSFADDDATFERARDEGEGETRDGKNIRKEIRYRMNQEDKIEKMTYAESEKDFISNRAVGHYVGFNVRPDVFAPIQLLAPGKDPTSRKEVKKLRKVTKFLKRHSDARVRLRKA